MTMLRSLLFRTARPLLAQPLALPTTRLISSLSTLSLSSRPLLTTIQPQSLLSSSSSTTTQTRSFIMPKCMRRKASPLARPVKTARKASKRKVRSNYHLARRQVEWGADSWVWMNRQSGDRRGLDKSTRVEEGTWRWERERGWRAECAGISRAYEMIAWESRVSGQSAVCRTGEKAWGEAATPGRDVTRFGHLRDSFERLTTEARVDSSATTRFKLEVYAWQATAVYAGHCPTIGVFLCNSILFSSFVFLQGMSRVFLIGIAGATCSCQEDLINALDRAEAKRYDPTGKTTLSKNLQEILPGSLVLHQDDLAPPDELFPIHPIYGWKDAESAPGAIMWEKQRATLHHIQFTGRLPPDHSSNENLNDQTPLLTSQPLRLEWRSKFDELQRDTDTGAGGEQITLVICEGFLMLYDEESVDLLDLKLFLREDVDVLRKRRGERSYDPSGYWEKMTWPAYLEANSKLFLNGDVENGAANPEVIEDLVILEASQFGMEEMVDRACTALFEKLDPLRTITSRGIPSQSQHASL
ncbi:hypothetical protein P7C70_g1829, partial [Phenoliferia sp. Uapishka_3]